MPSTGSLNQCASGLFFSAASIALDCLKCTGSPVPAATGSDAENFLLCVGVLYVALDADGAGERKREGLAVARVGSFTFAALGAGGAGGAGDAWRSAPDCSARAAAEEARLASCSPTALADFGFSFSFTPSFGALGDGGCGAGDAGTDGAETTAAVRADPASARSGDSSSATGAAGGRTGAALPAEGTTACVSDAPLTASRVAPTFSPRALASVWAMVLLMALHLLPNVCSSVLASRCTLAVSDGVNVLAFRIIRSKSALKSKRLS